MEICGSKVQLALPHRNMGCYSIINGTANPKTSYYVLLSCVRKEKSEMSFKFSIGSCHPISEIAASHICRLNVLKARVIKNYVFL